MSQIIKTEAVVIKKLDQGDSSKIVTLYSADYGKFTVIAKGIKSPKSKMNARLELFNVVEVVVYNKSSRAIQLVSGADIVKVHNSITSDLDRYQYSMAVIELYNVLLPEHEKNDKLHQALVRILYLLDTSVNEALFLFVKFFWFFVNEIGYGIEINKCPHCHKSLSDSQGLFYSYSEGSLCSDCSEGHLINFDMSKELFNLVNCLSKKNEQCNYTKQDLEFLVFFLEKHIAFHVDGFRNLKSLKIF